MIAYVFPGQGSQYPGMGRELAQESAAAAEVFRVVDDTLGFPLSELMFGEEADALLPTEIQQPAILAHSLAALAALRERHACAPAMVAGHSLGEYSAVAAAGCLDLVEAVRLVRRRGEIMAEVSARVGGAMAAVLGMEREAVEEITREASAEGVVVVANYNSPGQVVVSGETDAVALARRLAGERGGRAIPLKVSGAFHSPLMEPAAEALRGPLAEAPFRNAEIPVVSNVDATMRSDAEDIRQALMAQVTGSVRWDDSVRLMASRGIDGFVEVGPGTVLARLIKQIVPEATVWSVGTMSELQAFLEATN